MANNDHHRLSIVTDGKYEKLKRNFQGDILQSISPLCFYVEVSIIIGCFF